MDIGAAMIGLFVLVYGILAAVALRRPLLARLAFREAVRRPWQSALLVAGLMTGSAAILCMNAVIDSSIDSAGLMVEQTWGRVDLEVANGGAFFSSDVAARLAADPAVSQRLAGVQPGVELVGAVTDLDRDTVRPTAHIIGFDPSSQAQFGTFVLAGGRQTTGADLQPGEVLISQQLADSLDAHLRDRLQLTSGGRSAIVAMAGITQLHGAGAFGIGPGLGGTVFAPLMSLPPVVDAGKINVIRLTAGGLAGDEVERAHKAVPAVNIALAGISDPLLVREVKADDLKVAGSGPRAGRGFFTSIGMIVVVAGTLLIVNLMLALSEERRPRLAVLRALGLSRSAQVLMSVLEASVYALVAGVLGIGPGLLLAVVMLNQLGNAVGAGPQGFRFSVQGYSVVVAVAAGTVITLATAAAASFRGSRMTIAAAVKNMPERLRAVRRRRWTTPAVSGAAIAAVAGLISGQPVLKLLGGTVIVAIAASVAGRRLGTRPRALLLGAALTTWAVVSMTQGPGPGAWLWVAWIGSTVLATFGLAVIITAGFKVLETTVAGWGSPTLRATLRPPLAYLSRRPIPAALGITSTAVVVSLLFLVQQLATTTEANLMQGAGIYDVAVVAPGRSDTSVPENLRNQVTAQVPITSRVYIGSIRTYGQAASNDSTTPHQSFSLYSLTDDQIAHPVLTITTRAPGYSSDADVWRAMATDPAVVLTNGMVGDSINIELQAGSMRVHYRPAGSVASPFLNGIVGSRAAFNPFESLPAGQTILLETARGTDPQAFARQLQKALLTDGAQVVTLQEAAALAVAARTSFDVIFELLLTVGLLVGVSSLGIVALRAVVERRRAIGVLRALGYQPRAVLGGMLIESLLTGASGALVGVALGLIEGYSWVTAQNWAAAAVDWSVVAGTVGLILAAVMLVTIAPALQASRLAPAEALRLVD